MNESVSGGRRARRKSGGTAAWKWAAVAVVAVGLIAVLALGVGTLGKKMQATRKLSKATVLVEEADAVLVKVDEVVSAQISTDLASQAVTAYKQLAVAESKLNEADALIGEAAPSLGKQDRQHAYDLQASAQARLQMLAEAPPLLDLNEQASTAMPLAREGWAALVSADELSQAAVAAYNKLTKAGVTESQRLNKQAGVQLAAAKEKMLAAEKAFPAAAFEQYVAYADHRIAINQVSQATDKAWLAGDILKANQLIGQYNIEDAKAVAEFKKLPTSTDAAVGAAYDKESAGPSKAYYAARDKALKADRKLQ
jgi:hypothetical protein